jgi:hypothetical protein
LCLFTEKEQKSHKICSEIVHHDNDNTLAYVFSIEKLYGNEEVLVVRLVMIEKADQNMSEYNIEPDGLPKYGTTAF